MTIISLAPMDWVTDASCRWLTQEIFQKNNTDKNLELQLRTEFMNADWFIINPRWLNKHLLTIKNSLPTWAQIYWWNIETLVETAIKIQKTYSNLFAGIELNIWCPSPKVMACWWWSWLMKDKKHTLNIIQKISKNIDMPFSIKTRIWLNNDDKDSQFDFILEASSYCDIIAIHWRTLKSSHSWNVDRDFIYKVKSSITNHCKIIGNWWIWNPSWISLDELIERNSSLPKNMQLDWFMVWQASIGNPRIFTKHKPTKKDIYMTILRHLHLSIAIEIRYKDQSEKFSSKDSENLKMPNIDEIETIIQKISSYEKSFKFRAVIEFRKFLFNYVKWIPWSKEFKVKVSTIWWYQELISTIDDFFS